MSKAFLETTVLTDLLLKKDGSEKKAVQKLAQYNEVIVPQFSWKEFKRGPLNNFVWAHNKLAETKSVSASLSALQRMSRSPRTYLTSTAIQALQSSVSDLFKGVSLGNLSKKYGKSSDADVIYADALRLILKKSIFSSWQKRKTLFGGQKLPLSCYPDRDLAESKQLLSTAPNDCPLGKECCLKSELLKDQAKIGQARSALPHGDGRQETSRRNKVLRQIEKHPTSFMGKKECRWLGDAYFVLFCPTDSDIVSTNTRDIEPMANELGIAVASP